MFGVTISWKPWTKKGRKIKILKVIDEYTRECLVSFPAKRILSGDVINILRELFLKYGTPEYIRSNNGSEFIDKKLREWLERMEVALLYILSGSPWKKGFCESFNSTMANELLNIEVFDSLFEVKVLIERWVKEYNKIPPHSALGYRHLILLLGCNTLNLVKFLHLFGICWGHVSERKRSSVY